MSIRVVPTEGRGFTTTVQHWLYRLAYDFDVARLNPPVRSIITNKQDGKHYEELLNDPDWLSMGYIPQPQSTLGWFRHHLIHGMMMGYPLRSVIAFSILHAVPHQKRVSNMKPNRLDVWLDDEDIKSLHKLAKHYDASRQRVLESALAQLRADELADTAAIDNYKRTTRIPIRFDALAREQLNNLTQDTDLSNQDVLRLALKRMSLKNL